MPAGPDRPATASVVIVNFNFGHFVGAAIESALRQRRRPLDVIVVDDGSTDDSRAVISSFGAAVRPVFKENGGHASAINAGCRIAGGDFVFLLDSDDLLKPEAVDTVLTRCKPETVMVQSRLELVDAEGRAIRGTVPAHWVRLDEGHMADRLLDLGAYSTTVTSGLAFRRDALRQVLPIPEGQFRQGADGYLVRAVAFLGPVQAIEEPLGSYRRHSANYTGTGVTPAQAWSAFGRRFAFYRSEFALVRSLAAARGLGVADDLGEREPNYLLLRLFSVTIDRRHHPLPEDTRLRLLPAVVCALARERNMSAARRLFTIAEVTAVSLLPRSLAQVLVMWSQSPASRPRSLVWAHSLVSRHGRRLRSHAP